ncbi:hypothetical protein Sgly_1532 [Syntrophobotulus glycolicus DSM 8271]|uniref:FeoB-associated Cys-rich membrane protein n=1 Tax=Syntrophobotulus glycolicus (strain DSM 8271 / FlGlyR) TaxID=645991 RepID=F0SXJ9_SYNGF|nr:FeoB-associated Cys-rich membrane protein [Syntrophobotulus glycolicus]ADY55832.1 hypothetical protein Sgly_1532 [Syntrophobotulus glycolicus DSM 8271]
MNTGDFGVIAVIAVILVLAVTKIVRDKKKGIKCPGCGECECSSHKSDK